MEQQRIGQGGKRRHGIEIGRQLAGPPDPIFPRLVDGADASGKLGRGGGRQNLLQGLQILLAALENGIGTGQGDGRAGEEKTRDESARRT